MKHHSFQIVKLILPLKCPKTTTSLMPTEYQNALQNAIVKFFPLKGGGEVQGQKLWKYDFEITGDPKIPLRGQTFCLCF